MDSLLDFGPVEDRSKEIIKVIGVGGGGCNAVNNMYREGIVNVTFAVCNTDSQNLEKSPVPVKILLGDSGLGAGADPEKGRQEAENTIEQIRSLFDDNTKMCFITAGMGGGTGTGAAPVIASIAKSMGVLTVGIVTIPFFFEKRNKIIKALKGVEEMRKNVDSLLIVNNERLCDVYSDSQITIKEAFKAADRILSDATRSISELITVEGNINLDFRDVETTMRGGGGALMAMGRAHGERRVEKAILDALDSPLLYGSDISKAKNILFNIYTSDEAPLFVKEMQEIDAFMYELDPNIDVIWGTSDDNTLGKDAKVIILATGLDNNFEMQNDPLLNAEEHYNQIISQLYRENIPSARPASAFAAQLTAQQEEISEPETASEAEISWEASVSSVSSESSASSAPSISSESSASSSSNTPDSPIQQISFEESIPETSAEPEEEYISEPVEEDLAGEPSEESWEESEETPVEEPEYQQTEEAEPVSEPIIPTQPAEHTPRHSERPSISAFPDPEPEAKPVEELKPKRSMSFVDRIRHRLQSSIENMSQNLYD